MSSYIINQKAVTITHVEHQCPNRYLTCHAGTEGTELFWGSQTGHCKGCGELLPRSIEGLTTKPVSELLRET